MATAKGVVRHSRGRAAGVLVELFSVPDDFHRHLPVNDRAALAKLAPRRLGSDLTDIEGQFTIEYEDSAKRQYGEGGDGVSARSVNLWLVASAYGKDRKLTIVYQDAELRVQAGPAETFLVLIDEQNLPSEPPAPAAAAISPGEMTETISSQQVLSDQLFQLSKATVAARAGIRREFRERIRDTLAKELSSVGRDSNGSALDLDFVELKGAVRDHTERRIKTALQSRFQEGASESMVLRGRLSLTEAQVAAIKQGREIDPATNSLTIEEDKLEEILRMDGATGLNPEQGEASLSRIETVQKFCRELSDAERCLFDLDDDHHGGSETPPAEPVPIEQPQPGDHTNVAGDSVTEAELQSRMPHYIARILDENSVLDSGFDALKGPDSQLTEQDIGNRKTFPSLSLPPGPADVPAFHDFHSLQIAFRPVWTEALDDTLLADAERAYERYVELGGDPSVLTTADGWRPLIGILNTTLSVNESKPPEFVAGHVDISAEEWNSLPATYQQRLQTLALSIRNLYAKIQTDQIGSHKFNDGLNGDDQKTFESVVKFVETRVAAYSEEAQRIVRFARSELERRAAAQAPVPSHRILTQLATRALSQYPCTYFAATRKERSINFGLLVTYRQRWTPVAYQVGELIKSIPLAPKEVRKYSKKLVLKEKRARKEMVANLRTQKSETQSTSRAEAEIVQKAMDKTNFNATVNGTFQIGVYSASGSNTLQEDTQNDSAETKKSFHEAVVKAAREYKDEMKVELETESTMESEFQESGEISNPNDELTVTYLFYELERCYTVIERLHRLLSVVLVAQEMPQPADIDEDWLIAHRWIINRVLLDDSFKRPLAYVAEGMVAEEHALAELKKSLLQQRNLVEVLKEDVAESRELTESRYAALQRSMERSARAAQRKSSSGGLLGLAKKFTALGAVESLTSRLFGGEGEAPEAARVREAATRDAYERELERLRDLEGQIAQANNSLAVATKEFTDRMSGHLTNVVLVSELKNHVKDNILHYMQAVWLHEPPDQRWMRLKDVPVPVLKRNKRRFTVALDALAGSLANVPHRKTLAYRYNVTAAVIPPRDRLETVPLVQVADIDSLLGFKANYMIFAMKKPNALTDFMMEPYVERAADGFGITDPDDLGNMTLDEFSEYVCCLKRRLTAAEFGTLRQTLIAQLKKLLQSPLRDDEEIVVPLDAMYIEALPGARPILENFKLLHRQIDAAAAQEDLRLKKMEKLRYAQRLLSDELGDPSATGRYEFHGVDDATVVVPNPTPSGGGGPPP